MAYIDEDWCIGCTLCLDACPTDAIVGANKRMHTVIEAFCTGCELCIPVCPVDCITLENASGTTTGWAAWSAEQADMARARYALSSARRARASTLASDAPLSRQDAPPPLSDVSTGTTATTATTAPLQEPRRMVIDAALARARARVVRKPG